MGTCPMDRQACWVLLLTGDVSSPDWGHPEVLPGSQVWVGIAHVARMGGFTGSFPGPAPGWWRREGRSSALRLRVSATCECVCPAQRLVRGRRPELQVPLTEGTSLGSELR